MTWTHTSRGRALDLLDPDLDDVDLDEVARALAQTCRYNGCTLRYYSVAEHCVLVSRALERDGHPRLVQLAGLLHDAAEAYTGDITWPVQAVLWLESTGARGAYRAMQSRLDELICQLADLEYWDELSDGLHRDPVRTYDLRILLDERPVLLAPGSRPWAMEGLGALGVQLHCWAPEKARTAWLARLRELAP